MNVTLIDLPAVRIAGLRCTGPYGPALGEFWRQRFLPWVQQHGLGGRPMYGISLDDPEDTPPEACRCDTMVEVDAAFQPAGDAFVSLLLGGRYAALRFEGSSAEIGAAWQQIFGTWLPESSHRIDARPCFERYQPQDFPTRPGQVFTCDICIPIVPR